MTKWTMGIVAPCTSLFARALTLRAGAGVIDEDSRRDADEERMILSNLARTFVARMSSTRVRRLVATLASSLAVFPAVARAGTWVAFQNSYTRGTGLPVTVTSTFTLLNPGTQYTLKAFNGGLQNDTTDLVSSSVVSLNGAQVVGPSNFNQTGRRAHDPGRRSGQ
jgi:hypothetical protein